MAKGIGAGFKIDNASNVLTNVSGYIRTISPAGDVERNDETTLQPDVANPIKVETSGFRTRGYTLTVLWSPASYSFFAAIEGLEGLDYEYGPGGFTVGDQKISGLCNCLNVTDPSASTQGSLEFTVELNVTSRAVSVY